MNNSTHYIKTSFRHDDYIKDILESAATLTKLSQSELIRNACLGQYVLVLQRSLYVYHRPDYPAIRLFPACYNSLLL